MKQFIKLYKQKLHFIKWYIYERTIHPEIRLIRGLIAVTIVLVFATEFMDVLKDVVPKITVQDGKLVNV